MNAPIPPFRWYREPLVWLGGVVFFGSLYGCINLIQTAWQNVDPPVPEPVTRTAKMQVSAERVGNTLPATARLEREGDRLQLTIDPAGAAASSNAPSTLTALFWNARAELDVLITLQREGDGNYHASWPALPAAADMRVRIETPTQDDVLIGDWPADAQAAELHEPRR